MDADTTYEFKNNALFIRDKYSACSIEWNNRRPVAKELLGDGKCKQGYPEQRILVPAHINAGEYRTALDAFAAKVPAEVFKLASPFSCNQWMLMRLLAGNPFSLELAHSNTILAYCLANNDHFTHIRRMEVSWEQANLYSRRKQKLILQFLGFPSAGIVVKLLKKIDISEMSIGLLRLLRAALLQDNNPTLKLLSHQPSITPGMLALLNPLLSPYVTSDLLTDVAGNTAERYVSTTADKLHEIRLMDKSCRIKAEPRHFRSIESVHYAHDRIEVEHTVRLKKVRKRAKKNATWLGEPPVQGNDHIVPISTKTDLAFEGRDMRNCVKTYAGKVKRGEIYIYRVLEPERATLSIQPTYNDHWQISELKGPRNRAVEPITIITVEQWLDKHNGFEKKKFYIGEK